MTDIPLVDLKSQLTRGLAEQYGTDRFLGPGGMDSADVAEDDSLHRPVAIKNTAVALLCSLGLARSRVNQPESYPAM